MTRWRLSCSIPSLALTRGTLEAEREREHQHDQAEETHHSQYEQSNYRCDRIFYVTVWLAHLLSSVLNRRLMPSLPTERLYERFARPVLAKVAETS